MPSRLLRLDAARADLARFAAALPGTLTLAASPLALRPRTIAALAGLPAVGVTLRTLPRDEVSAAVATGAADLGLVDGPAAPSDPLRLPDVALLTATRVTEEPFAVVLPVGHPLAGRQNHGLRLADLVDARWLDAPDAGIPLDRLRSAHGGPAGQGFRTALRHEGTDSRVLGALAAAGHGLTLLPASLAATIAGAVAVPLSAPRLVHRVELLHAGREPGGPAAELARRLAA
ncbi:LysR family transcriptional regulator substrate-binding protein [Streptomyces sp. P9(2023)]|uniref:LysR family transcriptional regulator substrate-binding protein n=1 Tax=Streptomyces sp. P9(2023) TaxID=3064394 RepID=UPI0028F3E2E6|nr:LysR family transcriptional regulator substrate-binding protein [Streptomyces sp. P9(2023)]MDT9690162.1 LysR family transcriptional regulator substrate-binding protein [Streptomyces sp. P9(2023)]